MAVSLDVANVTGPRPRFGPSTSSSPFLSGAATQGHQCHPALNPLGARRTKVAEPKQSLLDVDC